MRAVDAIMECLKAEGVEHVFGIPGGANLPTYDALYDAGIRHVQCRHEQGAGHAAEGYAKASGRVGVALATSGPGATNLVTCIADAVMDSVPDRLPHRPGADRADRHRRLPGGRHHRHHDADRQALDPDPGPARHPARRSTRRSTSRARGRPGPVLVDVPQDLSRADIPYEPVDKRAPPGLPAHHRGQRQADPPGGQGARQLAPPGDLRRRRDRQRGGGQRVPRALPVGQASRHLHADGPRRVPGRPGQLARACSGCTAPARPTTRWTRPT